MLVAARVESPIGMARTALSLGRLHRAAAAARLAFELSLARAESVGNASLAAEARRELTR